MPKAEETATIVVGGGRFDDWTSVMVQHRWADPFPVFRFSAAERDDLPPLWTRLQFKPGDECAIYLGGKLAINGRILSRQTAYDAHRHGVQLQGVGKTWAASSSSIIKSETGNYDGKNFKQIAEMILEEFPEVKIEVVGEISEEPLRDVQIEPGQTVWDNLERIGRPYGVIMGSDHQGKLLLIGKHEKASIADLIEGENIKSCQCVVSIENTRYDFRMRGQSNGSDEKKYTDASEQEVYSEGTILKELGVYRPLLIPAYQPVWDEKRLQEQCDNEAKWNEGTILNVTIKVYGWLRTGGSLWTAGDEVNVRSPMAMLNDQKLKIEVATFTQTEEGGTETQLTLVPPWMFGGKYDYRVGAALTSGPKAATQAAAAPAAAPSSPPPNNLPMGAT